MLADRGSVTRKAASPIAVTENRDHPRRAPRVISYSDWPTRDCRNANALVEAPRNQFATDKFRLAVNNCGNTPNGLEREQIVEYGIILKHFLKHRIRENRACAPTIGSPVKTSPGVVHDDFWSGNPREKAQLLGALYRNAFPQSGFHQGKDRCVGADAESQRKDCDRGECR